MKYKVGQKFKIRTYEEVKKLAPDESWNKGFFDVNAGKIFTIGEVYHVGIHEYIVSTAYNITLNIANCDDIILKNVNCIELDESLFRI